MAIIDKPLFIPLKAKHYEAFESGEKGDELQLYGPRWNDMTCYAGRDVVLSKGYGRKHRMRGKISSFKKQYCSTFGSTYKRDILDCFETLDVWIAVISINKLRMKDDRSNK
jgi:hypothetical protein